MSLPRASVVVCTHNRAATLASVGPSLLALDYPPQLWELIIVDNASTDDTRRVARELVAARGGGGRVVAESRCGLSLARNTGVRTATGDVIAFADDDAHPSAEWLRALVEGMHRHDALVAGGPVEPIFDGELPSWLGDRYLPYLAVWDRGSEPHLLRYNDYPRGNNMAVRREVFERFGDFSPQLGRTARSLLSCEETELCLRVERSGGRIVYVPEARIRHLTAAHRISPQWLARRFFAQGRSEAILEWRHARWRGLRAGWLRMQLISSEASTSTGTEEERIFARCARRARLGHAVGLLTAPLFVPPYRPSEPAAPWLPL